MSRTTTAGAATQTGKTTQATVTAPSASAQTSLPQDKVAMRAYQKWLQRGCKHGNDKQDWMDAEAEVRAEMMKGGTAQSQTRR